MFNTLKVLRLPAGVQYDEDCDYFLLIRISAYFSLPADVHYDEDCDYTYKSKKLFMSLPANLHHNEDYCCIRQLIRIYQGYAISFDFKSIYFPANRKHTPPLLSNFKTDH